MCWASSGSGGKTIGESGARSPILRKNDYNSYSLIAMSKGSWLKKACMHHIKCDQV